MGLRFEERPEGHCAVSSAEKERPSRVHEKHCTHALPLVQRAGNEVRFKEGRLLFVFLLLRGFVGDRALDLVAFFHRIVRYSGTCASRCSIPAPCKRRKC